MMSAMMDASSTGGTTRIISPLSSPSTSITMFGNITNLIQPSSSGGGASIMGMGNNGHGHYSGNSSDRSSSSNSNSNSNSSSSSSGMLDSNEDEEFNNGDDNAAGGGRRGSNSSSSGEEVTTENNTDHHDDVFPYLDSVIINDSSHFLLDADLGDDRQPAVSSSLLETDHMDDDRTSSPSGFDDEFDPQLSVERLVADAEGDNIDSTSLFNYLTF